MAEKRSVRIPRAAAFLIKFERIASCGFASRMAPGGAAPPPRPGAFAPSAETRADTFTSALIETGNHWAAIH